MTEFSSERKSTTRFPLLALILLLPAPSLGVWIAMGVIPGLVGQIVYGLCKVWLLALPVVWLFLIEKRRPHFRRPTRRSLIVGVLTGVIVSAAILAGYFLVGREWIDPEQIRDVAERTGIGGAWKFIGLAAYLIAINSLLEEYVWRWFVFRQCEALVPRFGAVVLSGFFFAIHHFIALAYQFDWRITIIGTAGVWIGGMIWSGLYLRYRNVWPGWISHLIADIPVLWIGWRLIFVEAAVDSTAMRAIIGG